MEYEQFAEKAQELGEKLAEGPEVLLQEIEDLIPPAVRDQIVSFPLTAVAIGVGIGIFLGMKKGDEFLSAGAAMISAAVTANMNAALGNVTREPGDQ
jgi:uncharacterized protein YebE (UPF0316 family)